MYFKLPENTRFLIDKEFEGLIPPLTGEEFKQLRENIIEAGECHDPIIVWSKPDKEKEYVILDGHNRWKIIQEYINSDTPIGFSFKTESLSSRNEAKAWMIRNQLGRRNLPNYERARLALQLKPLLAEEARKRQATSTGGVNPQLVQKSAEADGGRVRDDLAKAAGVSHDTIAKVEKIEAKAPPIVKEQLRRGELSINKAYQEIRQAEKDARKPSEEEKAAPPRQESVQEETRPPVTAPGTAEAEAEAAEHLPSPATAAPETAAQPLEESIPVSPVERAETEPEQFEPPKTEQRGNDTWKKQNVNALLTEIRKHTRTMTDTTWRDVVYSPELYRSDREKEMVAAALDQAVEQITGLLSSLSRRIRESKMN